MREPLTLPPVVYAPTMTGDDDKIRIRMHHMHDGRTALFVYSAFDRLEDQYGDGSPWVLLSVDDLQRAFDAAPYDLLLLDQALHPTEAAS